MTTLDSQLTDYGAKLWPLFYASPNYTTEADLNAVCTDGNRHYACFAAALANSGYRKLVPGHKFAAAAMCTDIAPERLADLKLPWNTFTVAVPKGLLQLDDREYSLLGIGYVVDTYVLYMLGEGGLQNFSYADSLVALLCSPPTDFVDAGGRPVYEADRKKRILALAKRLIIGSCVALNRQRESNHVGGGPSKRKGPPEHRVVKVGGDISIDCRRSVANYLGFGTGTAPTLQTLVRGHYRGQVCGPAGMDRKTIWVEPYWRGPEEALILVRGVTL